MMRTEIPSGIGTTPTVSWGSHICHAFEEKDDLRDALIPYFKAGLDNNEACFWVTSAPFGADEARDALRQVVPDLAEREKANQIQILDVATWYRPGQAIKSEDFISDLLNREQTALGLGFAGLRTNGNCSWVPTDKRADFLAYENMVQKTVKGRRMICMCSYGPHQTRRAGFSDIMFAHDMLLSPSATAARAHDVTPVAPVNRSKPHDEAITVDDVLVTDQLDERPQRDEMPALDRLVRRITGQPSMMLPQLVRIALEICDAGSAGVSVLERDEFRWLGLHGKLKTFEGANTPRHDSPCGVCLDRDAAILMEEPERIYSWIAQANISVPEVLLVPLRAPDGEQIGTLWVVADRKGHFNALHAKTLSELATFTGMALHMIKTEERLTRALEQERLVAGEMSHRVKNMYAVVASIVKMTGQNASSAGEMADNIIARLNALSRAHGFAHTTPDGVGLEGLLKNVLEPYANCEISGAAVNVGKRALAPIAMTFHELATNALKYGALGSPDGRVEISWQLDRPNVVLTWRERNGPPPSSPAPNGFGSALIRSSIASLKGTLAKSWLDTGLEARIILPLDNLAAK